MATAQKYSYNLETKALEGKDRPRRFLEAFSAILRHGNYHLALDTYSRLR